MFAPVGPDPEKFFPLASVYLHTTGHYKVVLTFVFIPTCQSRDISSFFFFLQYFFYFLGYFFLRDKKAKGVIPMGPDICCSHSYRLKGDLGRRGNSLAAVSYCFSFVGPHPAPSWACNPLTSSSWLQLSFFLFIYSSLKEPNVISCGSLSWGQRLLYVHYADQGFLTGNESGNQLHGWGRGEIKSENCQWLPHVKNSKQLAQHMLSLCSYDYFIPSVTVKCYL